MTIHKGRPIAHALGLAAWLSLTGLLAQSTTHNPSIVLARTRDSVLTLTDRLPKYTCMQTVNRTYLQTVEKPAAGASCDQFAGDKKRLLRALDVEATDRLRLDVIVTGGQEIFSWAGAKEFESKWIGEVIGDGPVGTGSFGTFLLDIFGNDGAQFVFVGSTELQGKTVLEYGFHVPKEASHYYTGKTEKDWVVTAFSGSFWINPVTDSLERLTVLTSQLPASTGACTADTRVDYQRVRLGTGDFLLPLESELHFLLRDGTESISISRYSKCREYLAASTLSFDEPSSVPAKPTPPAAQPAAAPLPNGLAVTLALLKPLDTDTAAAGDPIDAKVKGDVLDSASQQVLIRAGAIVHGRILRMEHRLHPSPHFLISLSWSTMEDRDWTIPFFARIQQMDFAAAKKAAQKLGRRVTVWLPPPGESNRAAGWFIMPTTKKRLELPAGYESQWRTGPK